MRKGVFLAGLVVLGIGFSILLLAMGIPVPQTNPSPGWIFWLAGMAFVVGGGLVCLGELLRHEGASGLRDLEVARAFRNVMVALLLLIFVVLGNWVAFGPGSRPVHVVFGLSFADPSSQMSEWIGRLGFGVSAVALDLLLILMVVATLRKRFTRQIKSN